MIVKSPDDIMYSALAYWSPVMFVKHLRLFAADEQSYGLIWQDFIDHATSSGCIECLMVLSEMRRRKWDWGREQSIERVIMDIQNKDD